MNQPNVIKYTAQQPEQCWPFPPSSAADGARIIQFDLPNWTRRIRAKAGTERVTILDGRPGQFECQFRTRIPLEVTL